MNLTETCTGIPLHFYVKHDCDDFIYLLSQTNEIKQLLSRNLAQE